MEALAAPDAPTPHSSLDEALGALFALGAVALHARRCSLYLLATEGGALALQRETGLPAPDEARHIPLEGTVAGLTVRSRVPLLVQNVAEYSALPVHPARYLTSSFLCVPILVENDAVGVLNAADRRDGQPFSEDDLQCGEMVARSMSAVLHSDLLAQRALGTGEVDPVTGLYNLDHLEKRLAQEVERAARDHTPLTLLLLTVGGYADLNARLGPQPAGVLMRCIGEIVAGIVRQSDVLARSAPEEIVVLLPSTPLDKARRVARVVAREVAHERLPAHLRYDLEDMDTGIGVAALEAGMDGAALIQRARDAATEARSSGGVAEASGQAVEGARQPRALYQQAITAALNMGIPYLADPAGAALPSATGLLDVETARAYLCVPIAFEGRTLTLAMADPTDAEAIQIVSERTGMAVYPVTSPREKVLQAIATLMTGRTRRRGDAVRIAFPDLIDPDTRARQMRLLADALVALGIPHLRVDGAITVHGIDSGKLQKALAAHPGLTLHPDGDDSALLYLAVDDA